MSEALYKLGGLRFWNEQEIQAREQFVQRTSWIVQDTLTGINPAWSTYRMEGPCLSPRTKISPSYGEEDIFITNHDAGGDSLCLRAETTASSYEYAKWLTGRDKRAKLPVCIWQVGKSFRRETNDGASASRLRFNEFYQMEFQCIYSSDTKADYRQPVMDRVMEEIEKTTGKECRRIPSDRLPEYSESTIDIEVKTDKGWREVASCSIRNDFSTSTKVFELAIGLDRVVEISNM